MICPHNILPDEFFRHHCKDERAKEIWESYQDDLEKTREKFQPEGCHVEILEEQLEFAKCLIEELEEALKGTRSLRDFRRAFNRSLDNSYFER